MLDAGYRIAARQVENTQFLAIEGADVLIVAFRGTRVEGFGAVTGSETAGTRDILVAARNGRKRAGIGVLKTAANDGMVCARDDRVGFAAADE